MTPLQTIILEHFLRYPDSQIEDFIKLLYQNSFGPMHLHQNPTENKVKDYVFQELKLIENPTERFVEDIGNGYVRIHLDAVQLMKIDAATVVTMFAQSMNDDVDVKIAENAFREGMSILLELCAQQHLPYSYNDAQKVIANYLIEGIHPIHHSARYNREYNPHYRVVNRKYLLK